MKICILVVHLLQLFISSIIVFFMMAVAVEFCLFIFRVKNARIRAVCRLLPIVKLPFDFLASQMIEGNHLFLNFNPLHCHSFLYHFFIDLLPINVKNILWATDNLDLPQVIFTLFPFTLLETGALIVIAISCIMICYRIFQFLDTSLYLKKICLNAKICARNITNQDLQKKLEKQKAFILTSDKIAIPCATLKSYIIFPEKLASELSQEEFETVVAHELEHLHKLDPLAKIFSQIICALFWWLPTRWWIKKMEEEQEEACDRCIYNYSLDQQALASAIYKVICFAKNSEQPKSALCHLAYNSPALKRMHVLLKNGPIELHSKLLSHCAVATALCTFTVIGFCIC